MRPFGADQSLFVIESEKAANEVGAEADGVLLEITAQAGETLPCGTVIGYWDDGRAGEAAEAASVVVAAGKAVPDGQRVPVTPRWRAAWRPSRAWTWAALPAPAPVAASVPGMCS
ncbi:dihydrolipoyllysine-residue acetyltransferase [Alicycliphilus sp. B1]|nr:dihydrolipoyllysine-residue acetyltransferase [Alicycliphilus sp. B1]